MLRRIAKIFLSFIVLLFLCGKICYASGTTVYITNTGDKYHNYGCHYLKSINAISLERAIEKGKTPCSYCNPPAYINYQSFDFRESNKASAEKIYTSRDIELFLGTAEPEEHPINIMVYIHDGIFHLEGCPFLEEPAAIRYIYEAEIRNTPCEHCRPLTETDISDVHWNEIYPENVRLCDGVFHLQGCPEISGPATVRKLNSLTLDVSPCKYCDPISSNSEVFVQEEPEPEVSTSEAGENNNINFFEVFWLIIILIVVVFFLNLFIKKDSKKETAKKTSQSPFEYYFSLYANKKPEDLVSPPKGVFVVDGLPATDHRNKYGLYSVYITPNGTRYHRRKSCANSNNVQLTNLYLVHKRLYPCKMCCQRYNPNMDFEWYEKYLEIKKIKEKYDIP